MRIGGGDGPVKAEHQIGNNTVKSGNVLDHTKTARKHADESSNTLKDNEEPEKKTRKKSNIED